MHREILLPMPSSLRCVSKVQNRNTHATTFHHPPHPIPDLRPVPLDMSLRLTENRSKHTQNHFHPTSPTPLKDSFTRHISKTNLRTGTSIQNQPTHRNVCTAHNTQKQHTEISAQHTTHRNLSTTHNTQKSQHGTQHTEISRWHATQKSQYSTQHTKISGQHTTHRNLSMAQNTQKP